MRVRLTKVESTHNNLRTDVVEGECSHLPTIGLRFVMYSDPVEVFGNMRYVSTSPVQAITQDGFRTLNSTYKLEVLT